MVTRFAWPSPAKRTTATGLQLGVLWDTGCHKMHGYQKNRACVSGTVLLVSLSRCMSWQTFALPVGIENFYRVQWEKLDMYFQSYASYERLEVGDIGSVAIDFDATVNFICIMIIANAPISNCPPKHAHWKELVAHAYLGSYFDTYVTLLCNRQRFPNENSDYC